MNFSNGRKKSIRIFQPLETAASLLPRRKGFRTLWRMNLKTNCARFAVFLAVFTLLTVTGCSTALPYQETRSGNYLYLNPFSYKPATPQEHLKHAQSLRERGHLKSAREQFDILVKRWPDSAEAAIAKQSVAEIYFERGKNKKAFTAYEELIEQYYTGIKDYDAILDRQYALATKEMNRKRMRWLFGGYRAPERAVPLFESIIQNAPQWERAPEIQYMIGQAYQKNDDQELAVVAYSTVEYRYPDSPFAEKAAVSKIDSFKELVESVPYSVEIREQAQLSAGLFPELYTNSQHIADVQLFRDELRDLSAEYNYEVGRFYERVPRPPRNDSAAIYYKKVTEQFAGTRYADQSAERLRVLFPGGGDMQADGTKAPILPVVDVAGDSGGGSAVASSGGTSGAGRAELGALPERTTTDANAIEVTADRLEYSGDLLIGEGNVAVQQTGASLQADHVVVNSETGEIKANGNILMIREGSRWEGQELVYNYKTREGTFGKSFMYFEPAYITADSTERVSTNEFVMRNAMITTCSGEKPAVYARAKEVRVLDEDKASGAFIRAKHVTFYVGPVPVFYTPVWQRHLGYRVFTFTVGAGGRLGAFVMGRAELHPTEWLTANTHFDLYSERGLGLGQDFDWITPNGRGSIETYHIDDGDPFDDDDTAAERALIDSQRYRVKITHREQLAQETYLATKLNWLSDPTVIRDFFNEEYREAVNPENYAVVQHSAEDYAASLRVDRRLNDFYTTVERIPELTYDWYRSRISDSPFFFQSENNVAFLEMLNAETNLPPVLRADNYRSARLDTHNQIFLPLRFKEFFNVIPRAGYRGTWYSETATGASDSNLRNLYELGTLTSFKSYKTLTEKSGFYGTGLRHIVEPYADYSYRAASLHTNDLHQFDAIDALDDQNEVRFGARNFLQSKRGSKRIANVIDSDVYTTARFEPPTGERTFSNLVAATEMSVTENLFIRTDLEYNWYTHDLNPANARIKWVTEDQSEYSLEYRYLAGTRSLFTPRVKLFPNDKWSYEFSASYDGKYDEWYERKILVNHKFDCVGMGVGLKVDEDDDAQFWIQFWLTAFPQTLVNF
jgi:lipopolysaccharide assembly outer membrane protein LptD (OstA)/outer membrane protein assembly factor BamD (BamD/ComL family)